MSGKNLFRTAGLALYLTGLLLPLYVFFHDRGGSAFLHWLSLRTEFRLIFPLIGLYAFTFVTWQILITTNLRWLRRLWPNILNFHRFQGSFALLFALVHPTFILIGYGLSTYIHYRFVAPSLRWWLVPAYVGLTVLIFTTGTALLAWRGRNIPWWRKLHRFNYLVFALVWLHSWFIGTDTRMTLLRKVWLLYLAAVLVSVFGKYYPKLQQLTKKRETYA